MIAQYPDIGVTKEAIVNNDSQENGFDILDPKENRGVSGFDK